MAEAAERLIPELSRRSVVRGAAWTVPVVAVATTAPAFAASAIPCPVVPPSSQWSATTITSGTPSSKVDGYAWDTAADKWIVYKDNASSSTTAMVLATTSPPFAVVPGSTNTGSFTFYWQYGNGAASQSAQGTFEVLLNGSTVLTTLTRPGTTQAFTTQAISFVAPAGSSTATLTYRYTIEPPAGKPASDDIVVTKVAFGSCTVH